jgi:cytochrome c oxidase subunit 2
MTTAIADAPLQYLVTAGPHADPAKALTWGLGVLSVAVTLIFTVAVIWPVVARRVRAASSGDIAPAAGGRGMWWIYAGLPLTVATLIVALVWTMQVMAAIDAPASAPRVSIDVTGRQWWWEVRYPATGGAKPVVTANEIHIPAGEPVLVRLWGGDVIHSFWVPALAGKTDTIPGRVNLTWLQADRPGTYRGQCTEYCGLQHAHMAFAIVADPPTVFARWRAAQALPASAPQGVAASGAQVFMAHCSSCHAIAGTAARGVKGPDLTHLMSRSTIAAGLLDNNVATLSGWVTNPQALKPGALMPPTWLSGPQLHAVVAYLETLT